MPSKRTGTGQWLLKLRVIAALMLNRRKAAIAAFDLMLQAAPQDAYALAGRAHAHAELGNKAQAIRDLQTLVGLYPTRSAADWFNLAFLLEAGNDITAAEGAFRRALALDPKLDRAWYGLGLSLVRQRRFDEAAAALKRNTELQPMSPYGWYQLARVHMDRHQPEEAQRILAHLKNFEPKVAAQLEREIGVAR
jgi:tetratricopeptide (TPR) repeat protein